MNLDKCVHYHYEMYLSSCLRFFGLSLEIRPKDRGSPFEWLSVPITVPYMFLLETLIDIRTQIMCTCYTYLLTIEHLSQSPIFQHLFQE